jgi:hypothetical protein
MPAKRNVSELIYTNHARRRMSERYFSEDDVRFIAANGEEEVLQDGCIRCTLSGDVPPDVKDELLCRYNRGRKIILAPGNVLKTVIAADEMICDFETYREYVQ